jgi:hypothetical protein
MNAGSAAIVEGLLAFVWVPLLVLAGVLDWACHRRLRIEYTAGLRESLLHLLMLALLGTAILAGLLLERTAGLFALVLIALLLHEAAYAADLHVALARRRIPAVEQWVHGFQHLLPWAGLAGLLALAPEQTLALLGRSAEAPDWALRWKSPLPPWPYTAALLAASLLFNVLPFLSEARRSARAAARAPGAGSADAA